MTERQRSRGHEGEHSEIKVTRSKAAQIHEASFCEHRRPFLECVACSVLPHARRESTSIDAALKLKEMESLLDEMYQAILLSDYWNGRPIHSTEQLRARERDCNLIDRVKRKYEKMTGKNDLSFNHPYLQDL